MKEVQDTIQVGLANGSAIALNLTECNEYLSFIALVLSIAYTIFKFYKFKK
tara:strand:+ start:1178 stop:1330 length:153 start_codon:yes stop_codon:yes gene_type:complete